MTGLVPGMPYTFQLAAQTTLASGGATWSAYSVASDPVYCTPTVPDTPAEPVDGYIDEVAMDPARSRVVQWTAPVRRCRPSVSRCHPRRCRRPIA